jgi:hypothetical protein
VYRHTANVDPPHRSRARHEHGLAAMSLGPVELLIILAIVLLLVGGAARPRLARAFGRAPEEFRRGQRD